jgi:hypothetical protein
MAKPPVRFRLAGVGADEIVNKRLTLSSLSNQCEKASVSQHFSKRLTSAAKLLKKVG